MFLSQEWLEQQGPDAPLLEAVARGFPDTGPVAIAVSGGGDSMALLHLAYRLCDRPIFAVTVDHGLRVESAQEAAQVAIFCNSLNIKHETLVWSHQEIDKNLQDQARQARYRLIGEWARTNGMAGVLLGHTLDDQAETFLMQMSRGAGVDGLSAMGGVGQHDGAVFYRPLLEHSRAELREYLKRNEIAWVDDPSNEDEAYHRIRIRKAMPSLQDLGISKNTIGRSVANIQSAKDALEHYVDREIKEYVQLQDGDVLIPTNLADHIPADILRRVWLRALKWVGNAQYAPRQQSYAAISTTINSGKKATLHGCLITPEGSQIRITRELAAVANLKGEIGSLWDGRWLIEGPAEKGIYVV